MRSIHIFCIAAVAALGSASVLPAPVAAKCSPGTGVPTRGTIALVVNGVITFEGTRSGPFAPTDGNPLSIVFPASFKAAMDASLRTLDVAVTEYGCPTLVDQVTGEPFQVEAVSILTVDYLRSLLPMVAGRQSELFSRSGRYSNNLAELDLLNLPQGVRVRIEANDRGWRATLDHIRNPYFICRLAVGDAELLVVPDGALGETHCTDPNPDGREG